MYMGDIINNCERERSVKEIKDKLQVVFSSLPYNKPLSIYKDKDSNTSPYKIYQIFSVSFGQEMQLGWMRIKSINLLCLSGHKDTQKQSILISYVNLKYSRREVPVKFEGITGEQSYDMISHADLLTINRRWQEEEPKKREKTSKEKLHLTACGRAPGDHGAEGSRSVWPWPPPRAASSRGRGGGGTPGL